MGSGPGFLKVMSSSEKMEIPTTFMLHMKGSLPNSVILTDRHSNIWPVDMGRDGDGWLFDKGWPQFYRGNSAELGDFLVFEYKGLNLFDFKLFGTDGCEKKEIEGLKYKVKEEEMGELEKKETEGSKFRVKEGEMGELEKKETEGSKFRVKEEEMGELEMKEIEGSRFRYKEVLEEVEEEEEDEKEDKDDNDYEDYVKQEEEEEEQDDDEEDFVEEEEKINRNRNSKTYGIGMIQTKRTYTKKNAACYGFNIFDKGLAQLPKNPFFVSRSRPRSRESELYIPREVIVDYDLEIPEKLSMVDERGTKWGTTVKKWKDGRLWCIHGWKSLRNVNRIKRDPFAFVSYLGKKAPTRSILYSSMSCPVRKGLLFFFWCSFVNCLSE